MGREPVVVDLTSLADFQLHAAAGARRRQARRGLDEGVSAPPGAGQHLARAGKVQRQRDGHDTGGWRCSFPEEFD